MVKKILLPAVAFATCTALSVSANALDMSSLQGWYTGGHVGFNVPSGFDNPSLDTGYDVGAQVGYDFKPFRVEGAYTYYRNDLDGVGAHLNTHTWMANAYYDFMPDSAFDPYVGAGVGWAYFNTRTDSGQSSNDNELAYQGIVGLNYHVNANWAVDTNYHIQSWTSSGGSFFNIFNVGLNYYF